LIDTNIVSAHFKGDPHVTPKLEACEVVYLPLVVLGELHFGARRSSDFRKNLERIEHFTTGTALLGANAETPAHYGRIKAELTAAGLIIPDNDIWIAALSNQHGVPLVSRDQHFSHVPGLQWVIW
jgi:tRNA(fMet)-specific endonuclease VapC